MMAGYQDPNEKYWADEETSLRKRGIDPMQVPQLVPPKYPTNPGNTTLHAKGGVVGSHPMDMANASRTDHSNKSYKFADGGTVPSDTNRWKNDPDMTSVFGEYGLDRPHTNEAGTTFSENRKFSSVTDPKTGAFVYRKDLSPERLQSQGRLIGQAIVNKGKGGNQ
jgi:hypothetical protein